MSDFPARPAALFLKKGGDYSRVKREGRRRPTVHFNLVHCSTSRADIRFGIVVGHRFGNAVKRNRAKRIVRELVRATKNPIQGKDCIVFPRRHMLDVDHAVLKDAWISLLAQEKLIACSF